MKIDLPGACADAWSMFRRHHQVLIAIAGMFIFLPTLSLLLLVPPAPPWPDAQASDPEIQAQAQVYAGWLVGNSGMFLAAAIMSLFAALGIAAFFLDSRSDDVQSALMRGLAALPGYLLASLLILMPVTIGFFLLVLPGLYILGRTMLVGAVLVAEPATSGPDAIMRSINLTRGNGLVLAAVAGLGILAGQLLPSPFQAIDTAMRGAGAANPIALALVNAAAAATASGVALAMILLRLAIYRRLVSTDGPIRGM